MYINLSLFYIGLFFLSFGSYTHALTGEIVHEKIVDTLETKGINSNPSIAFERQFPPCPSDLSVESLFGSWKTVKVACPDNDWKIVLRTNIGQVYTPTENVKSKTSIDQKFVVALKTSLNKGDLIKLEHLEYIAKVKSTAGGVFHDKSFLANRKLKLALSVGTILKARHLTPNWIINKNQIVTIEHQVGNILINTQGIAQEPGQLGEKIWVSNVNSGKKVLCWIKNDKKVSTNPKIY